VEKESFFLVHNEYIAKLLQATDSLREKKRISLALETTY
jgi:hypothetical protein